MTKSQIDKAVAHYRNLKATREMNCQRQWLAIVAEFPHFASFDHDMTDAEIARMEEIEAPIRNEMPLDITEQIFDARDNVAKAIVQHIEAVAGRESGLMRHLSGNSQMVEERLIIWWERGMAGSIPTMTEALDVIREQHDTWKAAVNA